MVNLIIIKKYDIGQIHSHHFPCLIYVGLAAIITNTPYNVFIHAEEVRKIHGIKGEPFSIAYFVGSTGNEFPGNNYEIYNRI